MKQTHQKSVTVPLVLNKALMNAARHIDLSQRELSKIIGASTPQISRLFTKGVPCISENTKEWECALLFLRIIRSLEALVGEDPSQVQEWLYNYNHHLLAKPIELMESIQGLNEVAQYLDAMRG